MDDAELMKPLLIFRVALLACLVGVLTARAGENFTPRVPMDHKAHIDEALKYLLEQRPEIKADRLAFSHLGYQYQIMDATVSVCDSSGCRIVPAAPFHETLSVCFTVLDSRRLVTTPEGKFEEYDTVVVQFPTPRQPDWFIGQGKSTSRVTEERPGEN